MSEHPKYDLDGIFDPSTSHPNDAHSILMRLVPAGSRVLELGCSSGYLSGYLVIKKGCYVTGVEVDPVATRIAASRCQEVYTVDLDTPTALDAIQGTFDVLLAPAVLEHLKYPEQILNAARAKLTHNANIIVSLPNIAHWSMRLNLLRGSFDYTDYGLMDKTHVHFYNVRTGRKLIESCGYQVDALYIAGSALQNVISKISKQLGKSFDKPIFPNLLGYELIYLAHRI
jgi:O-antigen biosynthesis protein